MSKNFDIVTFGSAVIDTFIDTEYNKKMGAFSYPGGSKILAHNMRTDIGGGATNTAVAFARLGFKTGCISKVAKDMEGKRILALLKKEKVKFLGGFGKKHTGHSIILDSNDRNRTILKCEGCTNEVEYSDIKTFKTKWLYFSSTLGKSFKAQERLAANMKASGTKLAFNPSEYLIKRKDLTKLLKLTDVLMLNKQEAILLAKKYKKKGNVLKALYELGPNIVVITDGPKTGYVYNGIKSYSFKPKKVKVVETTGAGDAFAAGFIAGIMANKTIEDCMKLGLQESTAVLKHFGAKNNLIKKNLKRARLSYKVNEK